MYLTLVLGLSQTAAGKYTRIACDLVAGLGGLPCDRLALCAWSKYWGHDA